MKYDIPSPPVYWLTDAMIPVTIMIIQNAADLRCDRSEPGERRSQIRVMTAPSTEVKAAMERQMTEMSLSRGSCILPP
jgi:nitrogen-specific signal transduction histidine kinase